LGSLGGFCGGVFLGGKKTKNQNNIKLQRNRRGWAINCFFLRVGGGGGGDGVLCGADFVGGEGVFFFFWLLKF